MAQSLDLSTVIPKGPLLTKLACLPVFGGQTEESAWTCELMAKELCLLQVLRLDWCFFGLFFPLFVPHFLSIGPINVLGYPSDRERFPSLLSTRDHSGEIERLGHRQGGQPADEQSLRRLRCSFHQRFLYLKVLFSKIVPGIWYPETRNYTCLHQHISNIIGLLGFAWCRVVCYV